MLDSLVRNRHRIAVFVSNYSLHNKTKYSEVLEILEKHKIPYSTTRNAKDFRWVKRGDIFARNRGIDGIKRTFWRCWQKDCVSLFEGRFLVCTRAYYIEKALNPAINLIDGINLNNATNGGGNHNVSARDFITFYTRDYFSICDYCQCLETYTQIDAGIQVKS